MGKALCLLEFNIPTGFGTVGTNLIKEWYKKLPNVHFDIICPNFMPHPNQINDVYYSWNDRVNVYSAKNLDANKEEFGLSAVQNTLATGEYDYFFICNDIGVGLSLSPLLNFTKTALKKANKKQFKSFFYFPIDNDFKNLNVFAPKKISEQENEFTKYECGLEIYDELATYTEFGRSVLLKHQPTLRNKIKVIPHATSKDFFVLNDAEKKEFRQKLFGKNADKFIFLNLNKNNPRKDLPSTIFAFEDAVKSWKYYHPQPFLYLHCIDSPTGWNLKQLLQQTSLIENEHYQLLDLRNPAFENKIPNEETINKIYNACDIGVTTATGGGWELFITECYATKLPLICPNHTSFKELSANDKYSTTLKTLYPCCFTFDSIVREQIDIYELSDIMVDIPHKIEEYKQKSEEAYKFVSQLSWNHVSDKFLYFFK